MNYRESTGKDIDWITILLFVVFVVAGWLNIFAAVYDSSLHQSIFDFSLNSGKQLLWILTAFLIAFLIMIIDFRFFEKFSYPIYATVFFILIAVLFFGREVAGSRSWFELGPFRLQPSEFAKFAVALALAKYLDSPGVKIENIRQQFVAFAIIGAAALMILLQGDTGSALVFGCLVIPLYREGMSPFILIVGIISSVIFILTLLVDETYLIAGLALLAVLLGLLQLRLRLKRRRLINRFLLITAGFVIVSGVIFSVDYFINNILKPHQQNRIKALINPAADPLGYGWNVTQSKIAIGSGGLFGKGFLEGTQTKFDFVPEQSTDFIFCTVGEEHGWIGSLFLIGLYIVFLSRLVMISERQKSRFTRIYGYSVASLFFFHFMVNIGMTIGLFPVIGIPLPFFSYGGSALWSFTILLFIFLKLDAHRSQVLQRGNA